MRYTRSNDRWTNGARPPESPDLSPALGDWLNCNLNSGEIRTLSLRESESGLVLRAFGADRPSLIDWGETPASPHVTDLSSREVSGFTAHYDFGFMETHLAANLKYGVLVIQSYNHYKDGSGRPAYFTREFFHQDLSSEPRRAARQVTGQAARLPFRMVGDCPSLPNGDRTSGAVDLSSLLGAWRNTYRGSKGIRRVVLTRAGGDYWMEAEGIGSDEEWGRVPITPHAPRVDSCEPAGFQAQYDFGFADLVLAANEAKGLLIIASYMTFRDGSGRSGYFTREFFYRESKAVPTP